MARRAARGQQHIEPEDENQDEPESEVEAEEGDEPVDGGKAMSKSAAARAALRAGLEGPEEATDFIRKQFGIEMSRQHFSAVKSQLRKREGATTPMGRPGRKPRPALSPEATPQVPPASRPSSGDAPDLIESLETLKPLIAQYGAEKVKRLVDLLG